MKSFTIIAMAGLAVGALLPGNGDAQDLSELRQKLHVEIANEGEAGPAAIAIIDGKAYTPGAIYCTNGERGSRIAFAGTLADQPIFRIDVFGEGSDENMARFDFDGEDEGDQIVWQLREGEIAQHGPVFEAIGHAQVIKQEIVDGTVVDSMAIPGKEREPVAAVIRCE